MGPKAADALESKGASIEYLPNHVAATEFPETAEELAAYDRAYLGLTERVWA